MQPNCGHGVYPIPVLPLYKNGAPPPTYAPDYTLPCPKRTWRS